MRRTLLLVSLIVPMVCLGDRPGRSVGPTNGATHGATDGATNTTQPARDAAWAQPIHLEGVPNLHRVSAVLYRSAQPAGEGMARLKAMGIKTVINLRSFHSDDEALAGTGMRSFEIPMKTWHAESEDAIRFLRIVSDPANQPVLVHCQHGADRTGSVCAVYRMAVQGWTEGQAVREMTDGGYGFHGIWVNLKPWLRNLDVEQVRRDAGIGLPTSRPR